MNKEELLKKGNEAFKENRFNHAVEYFQAVLEEELENEEANMGLALAYMETDNIFKAKRHLFRILSNDPNHQDALNHIKRIVFNDDSTKTVSIVEKKEEDMGDTDKDFRVANWGDSIQLIEKREGEINLAPNPDVYVFDGNVASLPCTVVYCFTDNQFTMGKYIFNVNHSNLNDYIYDYEELVGLLTNKYGKPIHGGKDNAIWFDDLYQDDYSDWGMAISCGHLAFDATWETPNTEILCQLNGDNYEISLVIQYVSKNLAQLREKDSKMRKMRGL